MSTKKQGKSGLGLEAQRETVMRFTGETPVAEFIEVESGSKRKRKELDAAIKTAKDLRCKLVIAKLDRLARDVEFTFMLKNAKVDFEACDIPDANTLTIGIMATMAQYERERISTRIKDALAARKARGLEHPKNNNTTPEVRQKAIEAISHEARNHESVINVRGYIKLLKESINPETLKPKTPDAKPKSKHYTFRQIAAILNSEGKRTRTGAEFTQTTVKRIYDRYIEELNRSN